MFHKHIKIGSDNCKLQVMPQFERHSEVAIVTTVNYNYSLFIRQIAEHKWQKKVYSNGTSLTASRVKRFGEISCVAPPLDKSRNQCYENLFLCHSYLSVWKWLILDSLIWFLRVGSGLTANNKLANYNLARWNVPASSVCDQEKHFDNIDTRSLT